MATKLLMAVVLCDIPSHALKAGDIVEGEPALIKALCADGAADNHKDAVAYAQQRQAKVTRSSVELQAEALAARREQLLVEVAKAEAALGQTEDEAVKAALNKDLAASRAALAELDT